MDEHDWLAERFTEHRPHLRAVAYRMLGSLSDADDAVQEAWLRLSRSDASGVENMAGFFIRACMTLSLGVCCCCGCQASTRPPRSHRPVFTCHRYDRLRRRNVTHG